jgi:hypothetical protein
MDPETNSLRCTICHSPFKGGVVPKLEVIPELGQYASTYFRFTGLIGGAVQYILTVDYMVKRTDFAQEMSFYRSLYAIICFQVMYFGLLMQYVKVENKLLYIRALRGSVLMNLLVCHGALLGLFLCTNDILTPYIIYCLMNAYWKEHVKILNEINRMLVQQR